MIIPRDKYLQELKNVVYNGMIKITTGAHRYGESHPLFGLFGQSLLENGMNEEHIIQVDLEDRRGKHLKEPDILLDYIGGHITDNDMHYTLLDEIRLVPGFEDILSSYLKIKNTDVYVTESNSRMLSNDVKAEFHGRGYETRIHPPSSPEFLRTRQYINEPSTLQDYMVYGGMPQVVSSSDKRERENYLKSSFRGTYIYSIKEYCNIRNDDNLNELIDITASNIGCSTNPTNLENTFKPIEGHSISDTTIQSYLGMLQDAPMLEKITRYDTKGRYYINTPSKYYSGDVRLHNARLNYHQIDGGRLIENIMYNELCIKGYSVDIGQAEVRITNDDGRKIQKLLEVNLIRNNGGKCVYIQSALDMPTQEKIGQETNSLRHIRDGFPKMAIVGGLTPSRVNVDGISITNTVDFFRDAEGNLLQI